jgi:hypothetical protein
MTFQDSTDSTRSAPDSMGRTAQLFLPSDDLFPRPPPPAARTARVLPALLLGPPRCHPSKSKPNAVFDETHSPEKIMAAHNSRFAAAHARRAGLIRLACDKQWNDDERVRRLRAPNVRRHVEPVDRPRDAHVLEQVLSARDGQVAAEHRVLPPEQAAVARRPKRYFFC